LDLVVFSDGCRQPASGGRRRYGFPGTSFSVWVPGESTSSGVDTIRKGISPSGSNGKAAAITKGRIRYMGFPCQYDLSVIRTIDAEWTGKKYSLPAGNACPPENKQVAGNDHGGPGHHLRRKHFFP
jgi:hypothetical protein